MSRLIHKDPNQYKIEYDQGAFDDWCVYLTRAGSNRYAPKDPEYFTFFQQMANQFGAQTVYNHFAQVYNATTKSIDPNVFALITNISQTYGPNSIDAKIWFIVIYAGMLAEENKAFTKLGKRIKRLGMHQVMIEGIAPNIAANFSKGKTWRALDSEMKVRGF